MRIRRARKRALQALRSRGSREPTRKQRIGITSIRTCLSLTKPSHSPEEPSCRSWVEPGVRPPPHFHLSPPLALDASAATIPGTWSAPLTTYAARVVTQMAPHADEYSYDADAADLELEESCGSFVLCYCELSLVRI